MYFTVYRTIKQTFSTGNFHQKQILYELDFFLKYRIAPGACTGSILFLGKTGLLMWRRNKAISDCGEGAGGIEKRGWGYIFISDQCTILHQAFLYLINTSIPQVISIKSSKEFNSDSKFILNCKILLKTSWHSFWKHVQQEN